MLLTKRDDEIRDFLKEVSIADTSTISTLFFKGSIRSCQRRLKQLTEYKFIKRLDRVYLNQEYLYYVNKIPSQLDHKLIFSQFLGRLKELGADIIKYRPTFKVAGIIPDGFVAFTIYGRTYITLVEIERTKDFNIDKYLDVIKTEEFKNTFPVTPFITVISNKTVPQNNKLDIVNVKLDFSDIESIL
ncbi:MAG: hypothetical protein IJ086_03770 [Clostridium sp.]|nr:hypothetical protein [Clostridium sp.]